MSMTRTKAGCCRPDCPGAAPHGYISEQTTNTMDEEIYRYIREHSTAQSEALRWVEKQTNIRTNHARMLSGSVQGELLRLLVKMSGASRVLELGTFTGYSTICLAAALPEGGHVDTLELNDELEDLILEGFERAGVADRISLHIGDCKKTLKGFSERLAAASGMPSADSHEADTETDEETQRLYDLVFIDANKREYCEYYDLVFPLVRPGGWILADNVLWDGKVCAETVSKDAQTQGILAFNEKVAADPRAENVILPLRDGLNIILKKAE